MKHIKDIQETYIHISVYLIYVSVCLSHICLSLSISYMSLSVYLIYVSVCLSHICLCLSISYMSLSVYLIYVSLCLSHICLSLSISYIYTGILETDDTITIVDPFPGGNGEWTPYLNVLSVLWMISPVFPSPDTTFVIPEENRSIDSP